MKRKTALILCAAGGLLAVAAILTPKTNSQTNLVPNATAVEPDTSSPAPHMCSGEAEPAKSSARFSGGDLSVALSSQKLLKDSSGEVFLAVDLLAKVQKQTEQRPPLSLAIVIDRSGSMSGDKLDQAKRAAVGLVERLSSQDRVAVVQYDDSAQLVLPSISMDTVGKTRARAMINRLSAGGGTNLHDGMALGRNAVFGKTSEGRLNRVILLSDGNANAGITDLPTLNRVASRAAERGVRLTTVGLGLDYNEDLMESLAEHGRGQYYYVQDAVSLKTVFKGELQDIQATVATNAEIRLVPACSGVEIVEVYGYHTTRDGNGVVIRMADIAGGDKRKLVARVRVPAGKLGTVNVARVLMSYDDADSRGRKTAELAVGVEISADAKAVDQSADKRVVAAAMEVHSARALRQAAQAYKTGDVARATRINRQWRAQAEKTASKYDLPQEESEALLMELDVQDDGMRRYAPSSSHGKSMIKGDKAKARQMFKRKKK